MLDYSALAEKWNKRINLVAPSTLPDFWNRHIADSAQLLDFAPHGSRTWLDIGSGGGLPALVVAIVAREERPHLRVTLVESDQRKAAFLREAARITGAEVVIVADRIERLPPQSADVISARAFAPLDRLLAAAAPHLAPGGVCLFPKGAGHAAEVEAALAHWRFVLHKHPSLTDPAGVILDIRELHPA